jgi:hypothetical protein
MAALEMAKAALAEVLEVATEEAPLQPGEARLQLERFALTANNVTYAVFGDRMAYWNFFPANLPGHGRVPVWGFGTVSESRCDGVAAGQRVYGYFPLAETLVVQPGKVSARGFTDMATHRQPMSPFYNAYETVMPGSLDQEGRMALLRPLFLTGWLIDRWLGDHDFFGARRVVASAASSKTALALASGLAARTSIEAVGLTSARSQSFVDDTGLWSQSVIYEDAASLGDGVATVYVDFAGNQAHTRALHAAAGAALVRSVAVGGADWDATRTSEPIPGPQPELFFAPAHAGDYLKAMGAAGFAAETAAALASAIEASRSWLQVAPVQGLAGAQAVWARLLANQVGPEEGVVVELGSPS